MSTDKIMVSFYLYHSLDVKQKVRDSANNALPERSWSKTFSS